MKKIFLSLTAVLSLQVLGGLQPATAGPIYEVRGGGSGTCTAPSAPSPGGLTGGPGVSFNTSASDPDFHAWYAEANTTSLNVRSRAIKSGGSTGLYNCAGSAARVIFDDLLFESGDEDPIDVSLTLRYQGSLFAGIPDNSTSYAQAEFYNLVTLNGEKDNSGNSTGLDILDNAFGTLFSVNCGFQGCTDENGNTLTSSQNYSRTIDIFLTHTWTDVPVNELISLEIGIEAGAFARKNFGLGGSSLSDFSSDGVTFASQCGVFGVSGNVTVSSSQMGLSDNCFGGSETTVPEPAALTLLCLGLAGLGFTRKKQNVGPV